MHALLDAHRHRARRRSNSWSAQQAARTLRLRGAAARRHHRPLAGARAMQISRPRAALVIDDADRGRQCRGRGARHRGRVARGGRSSRQDRRAGDARSRARAPRAGRARRWNVAVDDSGGDALADTSAGLFARLAAEAALGGLEPVTLLALLKHPLLRLGGGVTRTLRAVAALERAVLRGPRPRPAAGLAHALATYRPDRAELRVRRGRRDRSRARAPAGNSGLGPRPAQHRALERPRRGCALAPAPSLSNGCLSKASSVTGGNPPSATSA